MLVAWLQKVKYTLDKWEKNYINSSIFYTYCCGRKLCSLQFSSAGSIGLWQHKLYSCRVHITCEYR